VRCWVPLYRDTPHPSAGVATVCHVIGVRLLLPQPRPQPSLQMRVGVLDEPPTPSPSLQTRDGTLTLASNARRHTPRPRLKMVQVQGFPMPIPTRQRPRRDTLPLPPNVRVGAWGFPRRPHSPSPQTRACGGFPRHRLSLSFFVANPRRLALRAREGSFPCSKCETERVSYFSCR
jgi:hypothetical protein